MRRFLHVDLRRGSADLQRDVPRLRRCGPPLSGRGRRGGLSCRLCRTFRGLNWAVVLDERTATIWKPRGEVLGWRWREEIRGAEMLRGVRFARNSMHHDWSEVLELTNVPHGILPRTFKEWTWRDVDHLPARGRDEPEAERIYVDQLAGRMVRSTLVGLNAGFGLLREFLEPTLAHGVGS